ncbi:MAG TPA: polyamine aminopropyltransferase [Gammaproteobacteria bacterium]|jgi:spermidine synthase|nr:polyamine aminopropyltransferase [Gammaproteobacteria bacterium]
MALEGDWFTEVAPGAEMALGLKLRKKLAEERSPYQHIEIYDTESFGRLMVIDGCVMLTSRDNFIYHEMMAHAALFTHANPRRVVIIGGGDCGTLKEVLKHPGVEHVLQVDIDEAVTRLSEKYFPELCESNSDPRAELSFADGVKWIEAADAGSVDVLIVDSTDPVGPAEGLFAEPFYRACRRVLGERGIFVQQSESPLLHTDILTKMHADLSAAGFATTATLSFPQPTYPSGWWSATLAGPNVGEFRQTAATAKRFPTRYYTAAVHQAALARPAFLEDALSES